MKQNIFHTLYHATEELVATVRSGDSLQSGSSHILPEAERTYKRKNCPEFVLFLTLFVLKDLPLTFQKQPVYSRSLVKHLHKLEGGWAVTNPYFAEVCRSLSPKQFVLKGGKMFYPLFCFLFEVPRYHFANSKDSQANFFSQRASINCIWIRLQCHCQH